MKKICIILCLALAIVAKGWANGAEDPQKVKNLSTWVTYSTDAPDYMKEAPSYVLLLQANGVAIVAAQYDGLTVARSTGTWRIEGRRILFEGLVICDAITGEDATYKSATVKTDTDGAPYLVVKTTAGTRYFITL